MTVNAQSDPVRQLEDLLGDLLTVVFEATSSGRSIHQSFECVAHGMMQNSLRGKSVGRKQHSFTLHNRSYARGAQPAWGCPGDSFHVAVGGQFFSR